MTVNIDGEAIKVKHLTFDQWRAFMSEFLGSNPNSANAWDLITALRGPDSPSERPDQPSEEHAKAYSGRRERKRLTTEVIREAAFFGTVGGCARYHKDDHVTLPPKGEWDHFDRHISRAANILGLAVKAK